MTQLAQLNTELSESGSVEIDEAAIASTVTKQLIHDACVMYHANRRVGTSKSKSRAEVAGTTQKMYRQKGTGRARAGSRRSPIRVGGGHAFAKRPKEWRYSLPKKALRVATRMALRLKVEAGEVKVVDGLALAEPKTKYVAAALKSGGFAGMSILLITESVNSNLVRAARNIPRVTVTTRGDLNADLVMRHKNILIFQDAVEGLTA